MNKNIPYKTSRDYKRLKELLDKDYRIVCFIDKEECNVMTMRDISFAKRVCGYYFFTANGKSYMLCQSSNFKDDCQKRNVEFIDIQEDEV